MRFLVFDHYFWQDIEALRYVAGAHDFQIVSYSLFYNVARKHFPEPVFGGLEEYLRPEYANARQGYALAARRLLHELYLSFPFDAIVAPSDTFFYIRALVLAAHEMGLPFIVLQKETTISPLTMDEYAGSLGRMFPIIADLMVVCSERHKQFWVHTGAEADKIIVTGQPRFDLYLQPERWKSWEQLGLRVPRDRPSLLFLTYDLGAYSPEGERVAQTWKQLRTETEDALLALARKGHCSILIKPHPQQDFRNDERRLKLQSGHLWRRSVQVLPAMLDARQLIINSDIVVGFQTTALYEAMLARKEVVYTFWSKPALQFADALIPFHQMGDALCIARSSQDLVDAVLRQDRSANMEQTVRRRQLFEDYLGPVDGHAAERALKQIEAMATEYPNHAKIEARLVREDLDSRAPQYCYRELPRARLTLVIWQLAELGLPIGYPIWLAVRHLLRKTSRPAATYREYRLVIVNRRVAAQERIAHCCTILKRARQNVLLVSRN